MSNHMEKKSFLLLAPSDPVIDVNEVKQLCMDRSIWCYVVPTPMSKSDCLFVKIDI